jgi:hypothetical protein
MPRNFNYNYSALEYLMVQGVYYGKRTIKQAGNAIALQIASDINSQAKKNLKGGTKALPNTFPVPNRSFDLYGSQKVEKVIDGVYRVYNDCKHAAPVHEGHRAFTITAPPGKMLVWVTSGVRPTDAAGWKAAQAEGRVRRARTVKIPASRRRPFLKLAIFQIMKDARTSTVSHEIALRAYRGFRV